MQNPFTFSLSMTLIALFTYLAGIQQLTAQPANARLTFDKMLVYEQTDVNGSIVRYQILLNSRTGQFGFDKKLSNLSLPGFGDGFTFATGQPDGSYRVYVSDPESGKVVVRYSAGRSLYTSGRAGICHQRFGKRFRPTGKAEKRNGLSCTEYRAGLGRRDIEYLSLAKVPFHTYPLYLFNELALEAKLPDAHSLNFTATLAPNELLTESRHVYYSETINGKPAVSTLRLIYFGPTKHSFDISGYRLQ